LVWSARDGKLLMVLGKRPDPLEQIAQAQVSGSSA
jgi:hypothetical protein